MKDNKIIDRYRTELTNACYDSMKSLGDIHRQVSLDLKLYFRTPIRNVKDEYMEGKLR